LIQKHGIFGVIQKWHFQLEAALAKQGEIFKERMSENEWRRQLNNDPELNRLFV